jgi:hypothetical protein
MVFFNMPGLVILFGSVGLGMIVQGLTTGNWETDAGIGLMIAGPAALAVDLIYRGSQFAEEGRWRFVKPTTGGQLMFIPIWVFGFAWIFVGIHAFATGRGSQVAEHERYMSETATLLEETAEELENIDTRAGWEAAQERVKRCRQRLRELGPFYRGLDDTERRRLERKYGTRITQAAEALRLQATRLSLLPDARRPEGDAAPH